MANNTNFETLSSESINVSMAGLKATKQALNVAINILENDKESPITKLEACKVVTNATVGLIKQAKEINDSSDPFKL